MGLDVMGFSARPGHPRLEQRGGRLFIRFVVGGDDEHHRALTGVITEARLLRDRGELSASETARLEESYAWFNENLPVPPFDIGRWPRDVVAWFKDDAGESVRRMWEIVSLLRDHDIPVRLLKSANPGRVVYEDLNQVVVVEWNRL
jgi:hypothetical protein